MAKTGKSIFSSCGEREREREREKESERETGTLLYATVHSVIEISRQNLT